jgi:sporulation protein YlmC with PRC-barrel domain
MEGGEIMNLGLELLDRQLVDADGHRCGRVEDVEFEMREGHAPRVSAIISGAAALSSVSRGPIGWLVAGLAHADAVRIDVARVASFGTRIELDASARELGLGAGDARVGRWLGRWPQA